MTAHEVDVRAFARIYGLRVRHMGPDRWHIYGTKCSMWANDLAGCMYLLESHARFVAIPA